MPRAEARGERLERFTISRVYDPETISRKIASATYPY
jgi:hypothetical protein